MEVKTSLEWKISITLWLDFLLSSWGNSVGWEILERGAFCIFCFLLVLHQLRDVSCLHYKWGPQRRKAHMERGVFAWLQKIKEGRFLKAICKNLHFFTSFYYYSVVKGSWFFHQMSHQWKEWDNSETEYKGSKYLMEVQDLMQKAPVK